MKFNEEYPSENYYNKVNDQITVVNYYKPSAVNYSYPFPNTVSIDVTDWIWPRFEQSIDQWSYPLPELMLDASYAFHIGMAFN